MRSLVTRFLAAAALASACAPAPTPEPPPAPEPCLKITADIVDAALGYRQMGLTMTNCGAKPFDVNGYPVIVLFDKAGKVLDLAVGHNASEDLGPKPITLNPRDAVDADLGWRNTVAEGGDPMTAHTLDVAPNEALPAQRVDPKTFLDLGNTGNVNITAWMPHRR